MKRRPLRPWRARRVESGLPIRLGSMLTGPGDRDDGCALYGACLRGAGELSCETHCPADCENRHPVDRAVELAQVVFSRRGGDVSSSHGVDT